MNRWRDEWVDELRGEPEECRPHLLIQHKTWTRVLLLFTAYNINSMYAVVAGTGGADLLPLQLLIVAVIVIVPAFIYDDGTTRASNRDAGYLYLLVSFPHPCITQQ